MVKMMKNKLKEICLKKNIEFCGITNTEKGSVLVCLFPYYTGNHSGNLSKYAVVCDYHTVCGKYLSEIAETIPAETEKSVNFAICQKFLFSSIKTPLLFYLIIQHFTTFCN